MVSPEIEMEFDPRKVDPDPPKTRLPVTIWIDADVKEKYDKIQGKYRKKFYRHLAGVISHLIVKTFNREIGG